ncbi:MAG: AAA family ATPase [Bryobacteraceae bacterium]
MAQAELRSIVRRVAIKDFRSIAVCDVRLEPLVFLVGPNGGGKSNFLDALRFVAGSLRVTVEQALRDRGGIQEVRRRSEGHPNHMQIYLEGEFERDTVFKYGFEIGARTGGVFNVRDEICHLFGPGAGNKDLHYEVTDGRVMRSTFPTPPAVSEERLYLTNVSGFPLFQKLYALLSGLGFYNLNPQRIRELQSPDAGDYLSRDGGNLAAVVRNLTKHNPERRERILEYLKRIVPGLDTVRAKSLGPMETLEFEEKSAHTGRSRKFLAANMSDGTLRAVGVLAALFQSAHGSGLLPLIAVEEPEMALHPAAAGVLFDALQEASFYRQVLVTSHSPDLLDRLEVSPDSLLAVLSEDGRSLIAPIEPGEREVLSSQLRTAGELLRVNQLRPDLDGIPKSVDLQLRLFAEK